MQGGRASRTRRPRRPRHFAWLAALWLFAAPADAAVAIRFHSKDFGATFPHAFIVLDGTLDATGEPVSGNYGFTVRHLIGPSVLFGPVQGVVISEKTSYVEDSNHHFALQLTDAQYRAVMALVDKWRALPQPSYRLDSRNCVTFVAEVAAMLGLEADPTRLMRRPRAFLDRVRQRNTSVIAGQAPTPRVAAE
jgi:hypothetical protein